MDRVLWRTVAVFRVLALAYAGVLFARAQGGYAHPAGGWCVLAALAVWSAVAPRAYAARSTRGAALGIELGLAIGALAATRALDRTEHVTAGATTLPSVWPAAAVLSWALVLGWPGGAAAALAVGAVGVAERGEVAATTLHNAVLLLLTGVCIGWSASVSRTTQRELAAARSAQAAVRERERLGRVVHDGVLQVLALTARRTSGASDPELAELGRAAAAQERALRALVTGAPLRREGSTDLAAALQTLAGERVTVAVPAGRVPLPADAADELVAAVRAALDNVDRHAGPSARAWILLEDLPDELVVTVRDDGPGVSPERLATAVREGRHGVRGSVVGRVAALGGRAEVTGIPGAGTEVEITVPRVAPAARIPQQDPAP